MEQPLDQVEAEAQAKHITQEIDKKLSTSTVKSREAGMDYDQHQLQ